MSRLSRLVLVLCTLAMPAFASAANVYKCAGPDGSLTYRQIPCPAKAPDGAVLAAVTNAEDVEGCAARERSINEQFSDEAAAATREIRRLREQMSLEGGYSTHNPNEGLRGQLRSAEDRLDTAGRTQRQSLLDLRKECRARH